jgi:hypothetical protein
VSKIKRQLYGNKWQSGKRPGANYIGFEFNIDENGARKG